MADFSAEVRKLYDRLNKEAVQGGYMLNPDQEFTLGLVQGLHENIRRFGYPACPCRLAYGEKAKDIDIECPCYYRDSDLEEFGTCYCALYVNEHWVQGRKKHKSIPDRRPPEFVISGYSAPEPSAAGSGSSLIPHPSSLPSDRSPSSFIPHPSSSPLDGSPSSFSPQPSSLKHPVWRCKVCGYLCARDEPPGKCPICKASKDRFERFM